MCEYCNEPEKAIVDNDRLCIEIYNDRLAIDYYSASSYANGYNTDITINYCPMCGRNLKEVE